jgi:hypothetical protein
MIRQKQFAQWPSSRRPVITLPCRSNTDDVVDNVSEIADAGHNNKRKCPPNACTLLQVHLQTTEAMEWKEVDVVDDVENVIDDNDVATATAPRALSFRNKYHSTAPKSCSPGQAQVRVSCYNCTCSYKQTITTTTKSLTMRQQTCMPNARTLAGTGSAVHEGRCGGQRPVRK